jgi:hypothetical protein
VQDRPSGPRVNAMVTFWPPAPGNTLNRVRLG